MIVLFLYLTCEVLIYILILRCRKFFQWLITGEDTYPQFPSALVKKFVNDSFDVELGWVRRPNTKGTEKGIYGEVSYSISGDGSRQNPANIWGRNLISIYGDSFAFCRQVNDNETCAFWLANHYQADVKNFGVGNYGIDQALLRFEKNAQDDSAFAILVFVPETIIRIHTSWKHYCEYGNILGFKPRFDLTDARELTLVPNILIDPENQLLDSRELIKKYLENDYFYAAFVKNRVDFPPLASGLLKNNLSRTLSIVKDRFIFSITHGDEMAHELLLEKYVIRRNTQLTHGMYKDERCMDLMQRILERFVHGARTRGKKPLLFVVPQLSDLSVRREQKCSLIYEEFFERMQAVMPLTDLTETFASNITVQKLYINDRYGGHLNPSGCKLLCELIVNKVDECKMA